MAQSPPDSMLEFATTDELVQELKKRAKTLFLAIEYVADPDMDWGWAWKAEGDKARNAIALAEEAAFVVRTLNHPNLAERAVYEEEDEETDTEG